MPQILSSEWNSLSFIRAHFKMPTHIPVYETVFVALEMSEKFRHGPFLSPKPNRIRMLQVI